MCFRRDHPGRDRLSRSPQRTNEQQQKYDICLAAMDLITFKLSYRIDLSRSAYQDHGTDKKAQLTQRLRATAVRV